MRIIFYLFAGIFLAGCNQKTVNQNTEELPTAEIRKPILAIHGGAGYMTIENLNDSLQQEYHKALNAALQIGNEILINGGTSLQAVEKTG